MGMWNNSLRRNPPIGFFLVEIRMAGPCQEGVHRVHGCVRWNPVWRIWAWRAWRLPGRWPDRGRRSTVARWTQRRAAPAYTPIPDIRPPTVWIARYSPPVAIGLLLMIDRIRILWPIRLTYDKLSNALSEWVAPSSRGLRICDSFGSNLRYCTRVTVTFGSNL